MSLDIILLSIAPKAKPTPTLRYRPQHSIFEPHGHNYLVWVLSPADVVGIVEVLRLSFDKMEALPLPLCLAGALQIG